MENLKETEKYSRYKPTGDMKKDIEEIGKYINKLKNWIEDLNAEQTKRTNWILTKVSKSIFELIHPDNKDVDQDGNFKLEINSSGNLIFQYRESGTWTTYDTAIGPGTS
jgi:hypothetical protein